MPLECGTMEEYPLSGILAQDHVNLPRAGIKITTRYIRNKIMN